MDTVASNITLTSHSSDISGLMFYGAGCAGDINIGMMQRVFRKTFPNASLRIESDLKGACDSLYKGNPVVISILGTGSNACMYDGSSILQLRPSLGYILGDEGSGTYIGKRLLREKLYGIMPDELSEQMDTMFGGITKASAVASIYGNQGAAGYLSSLVTFAQAYKHDPYIRSVICDSFNEFLMIHVVPYKAEGVEYVSFVGSIAFFFREELEECCKSFNLQIERILQKPIEGLVNHHLEMGRSQR